MANVGERRRTKRASLKYGADVGERPRTVTDGLKVALKTTKVQAFGVRIPLPPPVLLRRIGPAYAGYVRPHRVCLHDQSCRARRFYGDTLGLPLIDQTP